MALILIPGRRYDQAPTVVDDYDVKHALVELCLTPKKGLGLFAKQDFKRGTRILAEKLLIVLTTTVIDKTLLTNELRKLSSVDFARFHGLQSNHALIDKRLRKRIHQDITSSSKLRKHRPDAITAYVDVEIQTQATFKTNATPLSPQQGFGIFPLHSRVNHSCTPDIYAAYNPVLRQHTVHAIRDIATGEELLTSYINAAQPGEQRTEALETFGVDCYCPACRLGPTAKTSERRRERLHTVNQGLDVYDGSRSYSIDLPETAIPRNPTHALAAAEEAITIFVQENLAGMGLAKAYRRASKYSLQLGAVEKAKAFATKEAEVELYCMGTETAWMTDPSNAEAWMREIECTVEKDRVKIRMCEKRGKKEAKMAEKKRAKKNGKR